MCSNLCYTPASLEGTCHHRRCFHLCHHLNVRGTGISWCCISVNSCCYTTNMVDWVVRCSNHRAILSLATTSLDLPVPMPRHSSPPAVPRLAPSGIVPHVIPRPKGPVYCHRGRWPFVYIMSQDIAVYHHARHSSLMLWGTFWAVQAMPGWDILIAVALASLACKSRELIRDVSHHGQTSAGCAHRCSVSL
jgi:hypothetical protein